MVTTETITSTIAVRSNVAVIMKPLAPSTPVNVANTGINTNATMLTANDHDRASLKMIAPASTTGTEHASAHAAISHKSVGTTASAHRASAPRCSTDTRGPTPSAPDGDRRVWTAAALRAR